MKSLVVLVLFVISVWPGAVAEAVEKPCVIVMTDGKIGDPSDKDVKVSEVGFASLVSN